MFSPAALLYLNPRLQLGSVEEAAAALSSGSVAGLASNMGILPDTFNPLAFLLANKQQLNISGTNRAIYDAYVREGRSPADLEAGAVLVSTLYLDAYYADSNALSFSLPGDDPNTAFRASVSNLQPGDRVRLLQDDLNLIDAQVTEVAADGSSIAVGGMAAPLQPLSRYKLLGIQLYDVDRLAAVEYVRVRDTNPVTSIPNRAFNPELYQLLYPEARHMRREEAFHHYSTTTGNNQDFRIARAEDLARCCTSNTSTTTSSLWGGSNATVDALSVRRLLDLDFSASGDGGRLNFDGVNLYFVSTDDQRSAQDLPLARDGLITERAIKAYVDRPLRSTLALCNLEVRQGATFAGQLRATGPTLLAGPAVFTGSVTLCNSVGFLAPVTQFPNTVAFGCNAQVQAGATMQLQPGAVLQVDAGASLLARSNAVLQVQPGGLLQLDTGAQLQATGAYTRILGGQVDVGSNARLTLDASSTTHVEGELRVTGQARALDLAASNLAAQVASLDNLLVAQTCSASSVGTGQLAAQEARVGTGLLSNLVVEGGTLLRGTLLAGTGVVSNLQVPDQLRTASLAADVANVGSLSTGSNTTGTLAASVSYLAQAHASNLLVASNAAVGGSLTVGGALYTQQHVSDRVSVTSVLACSGPVLASGTLSAAALSASNLSVAGSVTSPAVTTVALVASNASVSGVARVLGDLQVSSNLRAPDVQVQRLAASNATVQQVQAQAVSAASLQCTQQLSTAALAVASNASVGGSLTAPMARLDNMEVTTQARIADAAIQAASLSNLTVVGTLASGRAQAVAVTAQQGTFCNLSGQVAVFDRVVAARYEGALDSTIVEQVQKQLSGSVQTSLVLASNVQASNVQTRAASATQLSVASNLLVLDGGVSTLRGSTYVQRLLASNVAASNASIVTVRTNTLATSNLTASNATLLNVNLPRATLSNATLISATACNLQVGQVLTATDLTACNLRATRFISGALVTACNLVANRVRADAYVGDTLDAVQVSARSVGAVDVTASGRVQGCNASFCNLDARIAVVQQLEVVDELKVPGGVTMDWTRHTPSNMLFSGLSTLSNLGVGGLCFTSGLGVGATRADLLAQQELGAPATAAVDQLFVREFMEVGPARQPGQASPPLLVRINGSLEAANFDLSSDARLKRELGPVEDALGLVQQLRPAWFQYKHKAPGHRKLGFMAQEVERVLPSMVHMVPEYVVPLHQPLHFSTQQGFRLASGGPHHLQVGDRVRMQVLQGDDDSHHVPFQVLLEVVATPSPDRFECPVPPAMYTPTYTYTYTLTGLVYTDVRQVDYLGIIPLLVGAVQQLASKVM